MCCRRHVRHDASPQLLSSFHRGSAASDDAFACQSSALDRNIEGRRLKIGEWRQLELRTPVKNFWLRHCVRTHIYFLDNRTNGRANATVLRQSVVVCNVLYCG